MVKYDNKDWFKIIFSWHNTSLDRTLPRIIFFTLVATLIYYIEEVIGHNVVDVNPLGHSLIGVAFGLLLVFRNSASYDRYWEGRKTWGRIVNTTRNLSREGVLLLREKASDFVSLVAVFPYALKDRLRDEKDSPQITEMLSEDEYKKITGRRNVPHVISLRMRNLIIAAFKKDEISGGQEKLFTELVNDLIDCQGICERILATPIPFCHASHIKKLLFFYLLTLPFVIIPSMGWPGIFMITLIAFGLIGIEESGVEIEDPFGHDANDLPLDELCEKIEKDCRAITEEA